jgi:hypothetical protein
MGNFSIDREGSDRRAMAAAIKVLTDGKTAPNIFPEGNVYLTNDRRPPSSMARRSSRSRRRRRLPMSR